MLNFEFSYKGYIIIVTDSPDGVPYLVKCKNDDLTMCVIKDCLTRPEAFKFVYKLLAFIDTL